MPRKLKSDQIIKIYKGLSIFLLNVFLITSAFAALPSASSRIVEQNLPTPKHTSNIVSGVTIERPAQPVNKIIHSFQLNQVIVRGSTVYSNASWQAMYQPYIGTRINNQTLNTIAQQITERYQKDGFILSEAIIPTQSFKNGVVYIQIIEGYVANIKFKGNADRIQNKLLQYGNQIKASRPLQQKVLERNILLAQQLTFLSPIQVNLTEIDTTGAYEMTYDAENRIRAVPYLGINNRGTRYLGPVLMTVGGIAESLLFGGDATSGFVLFSPGSQQISSGTLTYSVPVGDIGTRLNGSAQYIHTMPDFVLQSSNIVGNQINGSLYVTQPLILLDDKSLLFRLGFDVENNYSTSFNNLLFDDRIRRIMMKLTYDFDDHWKGKNEISPGIYRGLNIFNETPTGSPNLSNPIGVSDFTKATLDASRLQLLPKNWSILLAMTAQYAFNPLLSEEQFSFGGIPFGRAYDPAEFTGDDGIAGSAELRYDAQTNYRFWQRAQYFTYYDIGKVYNRNAILQALQPNSGSSAGIGVRVNLITYVRGSFEIDKPLTTPVINEILAGHNGKSLRFFFSLETQI